MQIPAHISRRALVAAPLVKALASARGTTNSGLSVDIHITEGALVFDVPRVGQRFTISLEVLGRAALEAIDEQLQAEGRRG